MRNDVIIIAAEDDFGHFKLVKRNLERAGIENPIVHLKDGQEVLDYLNNLSTSQEQQGKAYLLLLDIRMPKVDGLEVLKRIKSDQRLKQIPVAMLTTTDDPKEVRKCHELGCSTYVVKPIEYSDFCDTVEKIGGFLKHIEVPTLCMN